jgi:hypothetical protein
VHWQKALGEVQPHEYPNETVVFAVFIECGFAIPSSDFFRGLLFHWGIVGTYQRHR